MNEQTLQLFKTLTEMPATSGFERSIRQYMEAQMGKFTNRFVRDRLGSSFAVLEGNSEGPKVMVAGHMDEVGFMITQIRPNGTLKFQALGGWTNAVLQSQAVRVITVTGELPGVIGSIPPHLTKGEQSGFSTIDQLFIDIGADDAEHARALGVIPGQQVVPASPFTPLADPKKIMAKAWDNRYGVGLAIELVEEIYNNGGPTELPNTLYCGATVQEEVGLRGAMTAAHLIQPDLFYALDCSPAGDAHGDSSSMGQLGKGVLLRIMDRTMVTNRGMVEFIRDTAETHKVPYQYFVSPGGTDAGSVHTSGIGVPSAVIGVCARYIHTSGSILHTDDYDAAKQLLVELVKASDRSTLNTILSNT
jgi:putative aminopeptidase FrvX